jgi:hypothetical protein
MRNPFLRKAPSQVVALFGEETQRAGRDRPSRQVPTFTLCCVLDAQPRLYVELVLWALCVKRHLPSNFEPLVYFVGEAPNDLLNWCKNLGFRWMKTEPVVPGSPHSNKIAPFFTRHTSDFVIVSDVDLFFLRDPTNLVRSSRFRAAPNNHCNPPPYIFETILAAAGMAESYRPGVALFAGTDGLRETHINNISAGIVMAPAARALELAETWRLWANWLLEHRGLLGGWSVHVDQVAFALAMEELREDVEFFPPQINTVLELLPQLSNCYALHLTTGHIPSYPHLFSDSRNMVTDGMQPGVINALAKLNLAIEEALPVLRSLPSTRDHLGKFLNPAWIR